MQREDSWPITLWKGKDPEVFFVFSIGGWKVLWLPSLPPLKGLLGTINTMREGHWLPRFGRPENTESQHLEGITQLLPKGETRGDDDGGVSVFVYMRVSFAENDLIALICEFDFKTRTSWEILGA